MLQTIGKHVQGWIAGVVVVIIAAAFVFWGLEYYISRGGEEQNVVASVNGVKITSAQLNNAFEAIQKNYAEQGVQINEQMQQELRGMAFQQLILDQVLLQDLNKMGFSISKEQIQQEIVRIPAFQENGHFSLQKFQQVLTNSGVSPQDFIQKMQNSFIMDQLFNGIQSSNFVTQNELSKIYGLMYQKRNFGYFILPASQFNGSVVPTEQEIKNYYDSHSGEFRTPVRVKVDYLLLSPESIKSTIHINPAEVQQYYQDNSSQFNGKSLAEVRSNIEQRVLQQKLNQSLAEKNEQLANLTYTNPNSLSPASKKLDLPVKTTEWISPQGIKGDPIFSDPKVLMAIYSDEVYKQKNNSQPIELKDGGFVVLRITAQQPSAIPPLAEAHEEIKTKLQKEQAQKKAGLNAYQIQQALSSGQSIDSVSRDRHLNWINKKDVTRQDKSVPLPILFTVFKSAPSANPAKKMVTTVLLDNGDYAIIQLDGVSNADLTRAPAGEITKLQTDLANRWGQLDFQLFAKSAMNQAKIKRTPPTTTTEP